MKTKAEYLYKHIGGSILLSQEDIDEINEIYDEDVGLPEAGSYLIFARSEEIGSVMLFDIANNTVTETDELDPEIELNVVHEDSREQIKKIINAYEQYITLLIAEGWEASPTHHQDYTSYLVRLNEYRKLLGEEIEETDS